MTIPIDAELIRSVLHYEPQTGQFTWKVQSCTRLFPGDKAGGLDSNGYVHIRVRGRIYKAHRLAYVYVHGVDPGQCIDHINGIKNDNRICNLRSVSIVENAQNRRTPKVSASSRLLGAFKARNRWSSAIKVEDKKIYLGRFDSELEAHIAYVEEKRKYHKANQL